MKKSLLLLLLLLSAAMFANAEELVLLYQNGNARQYELQTIGRIEFDLDNKDENGNEMPLLLLVDKQGNTLTSAPVDMLKSLRIDGTTALEQLRDETSVRIDASSQSLVIDGLPDVTTLRVYDLNGRLLLTNTGTSIAVGNLPDGVYLLQYNFNVVKFIKQ